MTRNITELLRHPHEISSLYKLYTKHKAYQADKRPLDVLALELNDKAFCYASLSKVSRSFSVVIQQLPDELKDAVCVFYLVLRALDSIEDDTSIDRNVRIELLDDFYQFLDIEGWHIHNIGDQEDYRILLANFDKVIHLFQELDTTYQKVIRRICREMGSGMIKYLDKEIKSVFEYDQYCYYVAGLVGEGLTDLFIESGLQDTQISAHPKLAISMGQFLQKTNIIRDFHEDFEENRVFWPKEIWGNYAQEMKDLIYKPTESRIFCLNHMIMDALRHATDCMQYLKHINHPQIFNFCVIPQVMAIATLNEIYANVHVFERNVKIRKGLAAHLIFNTNNYDDALKIFKGFSYQIFEKISLDDPNADQTVTSLQKMIHFDMNPKIKVLSKRKATTIYFSPSKT